ncbi:hypothetical protein ACU8KH_04551 [Lachancea thermotolerans]
MQNPLGSYGKSILIHRNIPNLLGTSTAVKIRSRNNTLNEYINSLYE